MNVHRQEKIQTCVHIHHEKLHPSPIDYTISVSMNMSPYGNTHSLQVEYRTFSQCAENELKLDNLFKRTTRMLWKEGKERANAGDVDNI
jgi:hypothetical protein